MRRRHESQRALDVLDFVRHAARHRASAQAALATSSTANCGAAPTAWKWGFLVRNLVTGEMVDATLRAVVRSRARRHCAVHLLLVVSRASPVRWVRCRAVPGLVWTGAHRLSSWCASRMQQIGYLAGGWLTMGQVLSLPDAGGAVCSAATGARASSRSPAGISVHGGVKTYLELLRAVRERGAAQGRSHRHRHAVAVRLADALRSRQRAFRW